MKSHNGPLCPAQDVNHPSVQCIHAVYLPTGPLVTSQPSQLSDRLSQYHLFSSCPYFTQQWPQNTRMVILAVQICQREAVTFSIGMYVLVKGKTV